VVPALSAYEEAERAARTSYGRLLALLAAPTGDLAAAEDALADAFERALATWPERGVPDNPDAWLLTAGRNRLRDLYRSAARSNTRARFAQYTNNNDNVQITYYSIMGAVNAWTLEMIDRIGSLSARNNFRSYITSGGEHCIAETGRFYGEASGGVRFRDWFAALVGGEMHGDPRVLRQPRFDVRWLWAL
jgi:hypothetical protein